MWDRKQQLELDMEQLIGSKLGEEHDNAEYIMQKAGLEESQTGIKIAGRNINDLRYADLFIYLFIQFISRLSSQLGPL